MVRRSGVLLKSAAAGISSRLAEILVCPLTKQPLRMCEKTNSLISDSIGVSFPIVGGIPRLVPADGKILNSDQDAGSTPTDSKHRIGLVTHQPREVEWTFRMVASVVFLASHNFKHQDTKAEYIGLHRVYAFDSILWRHIATVRDDKGTCQNLASRISWPYRSLKFWDSCFHQARCYWLLGRGGSLSTLNTCAGNLSIACTHPGSRSSGTEQKLKEAAADRPTKWITPFESILTCCRLKLLCREYVSKHSLATRASIGWWHSDLHPE